MSEFTTILVTKYQKDFLSTLKIHRKQSNYEVLDMLIDRWQGK